MSNYDKQNLNKEELRIEAEMESHVSSSDLEEEKMRIKQYKVYKPKRKAINIRLLVSDLAKLKAKANDVGIPYQTYIASKLHEIAK